MKTRTRNLGKSFHKQWEDNWQNHWWIIAIPLCGLAILLWVYWAQSFGVTTGSDRDADIRRLIQTDHEWTQLSADLARLHQIVLANPAAFKDPVGELKAAEDAAQKATKEFEEAGRQSLGGELIILSGVALQIMVALFIVSFFNQRFDAWWTKRRLGYVSKEGTKEYWIEEVRKGKVLLNEDAILKFVRDESKERPILERERGEELANEYREFMIKYSRPIREEPPWDQLAKLFYKLALICKQEKRLEFESALRDRYKQLRAIIREEKLGNAHSSLGIPLFFVLLFGLSGTAWNWLAGPLLGEQLGFWQFPIQLIGIAFFVSGLVHTVGEPFARWFTEKTWTDLDDILVGVIIGPLAAILSAIFVLRAIVILTGPATEPLEFGPFLDWVAHEAGVDIPTSLVVIFIGTWLAIYLLDRVVAWGLDRWAQRTEQKYDDMFVKVIQVFGTFLILATGIGAALAAMSGPIREATGVDSVLLPYAIIVSVLTAILGYASREGIENFFGGLLLQIEKPFDKGERIILDDGKICDVREVGMRSTRLYNVLENTEVSVPNSEMSKMTITNASRPDLELRISIPIWIYTNSMRIREAEAILLDIAYLEEEVDQMRVFAAELTPEERLCSRWQRSTIGEELLRVANSHDKIQETIISRIIGGGESDTVRVFGKLSIQLSSDTEPAEHYHYEVILDTITQLRKKFRDLRKEESELINSTARVAFGETKFREINSNAMRRALRDVAYAEYDWQDSTIDAHLKAVALREGMSVEDIEKLVNALSERLGSPDYKIDREYVANGKDPKERLRDFLETLSQIRYRVVLQVSEQLAELSNDIFAIAEQFPDIRPELDRLISELNKEPVVFSEYAEDGRANIKLTCNALYLERRFEVHHKLNRDIERRFHNAGIRFVEPTKSQEKE